ncbi:hypothetical protein CKO41_06675 [Thiococcus pfennigii]|nr:hypothetical protein [Thiococcus pfennigii]
MARARGRRRARRARQAAPIHPLPVARRTAPMSGIAGLLGLDGRPATPPEIGGMVHEIAHRGPDRTSTWADGPVGLGHCMLHTTPESIEEYLPLEIDGLVITADARIDNREDLIQALALGDCPRTDLTDSRIIVAAYAKWGEHCAGRLLGDFCFALWDKRRSTLFCARDPFGVRPFYYYYAPRRLFAFASEIKALFRLPDVPRRINEQRIGDYLAILPGDKVATFYEGISRLAPAHAATLGPHGLSIRQYWSVDPDHEVRLNGTGDYGSAYRRIFDEAVRCRLRSAFPVGSALSGGLDSSAIVCVARDHLGPGEARRLRTFSGVFDEVKASDERKYIDFVIQQGAVDPHYISADAISPLVDLSRVLWHTEEPVWTPNLFLHWGLYRSARDSGVRIFLDGFLGDNIVGHGWDHLRDLAFAWRWPRLLRELKAVAKRKPEYSYPSMVWDYFRHISLDRFAPQAARTLRRIGSDKQPQGQDLPSIIDPDFARRIGLAERRTTMLPQPPAPPNAARKRLHQDITAGEVALGLETANKLAASFSIDDRYPFSDRRLAEFSMAIPAEQRVHDGFSRMIVRRALQGQLPDQVCWRSDKGNLAHNLQASLLKYEGPLLDDLFTNERQTLGCYLDLERLDRVYGRYKREQRSAQLHEIWAAANLAAWLRQHPALTPSPRSAQQRTTEVSNT